MTEFFLLDSMIFFNAEMLIGYHNMNVMRESMNKYFLQMSGISHSKTRRPSSQNRNPWEIVHPVDYCRVKSTDLIDEYVGK